MTLRVSPAAFLAVAVVACCGWLAVYARGEVARELQKSMESEVTRGHFSGVVFVKRGDRVIFGHAYGYANAERHEPNTLDTKFRIGSITKTFTALVIMQLEGEGKLALTDPICKYMDECPPGWRGITLHHLLSHTSGIYNHTRVDELKEQDTAVMLATAATREQVLARFLHEPLAFAPGARFEYSNSNFWLLGRVIERVTGQTYEAALQQRIFGPLGMHDTGLTHEWSETPYAARGYWVSRLDKFEPAPVVHGSRAFADGGIYSTVHDLEKLSDALDSGKLLARATLERMWKPVDKVYGYGWSTPPPSRMTMNRRVVGHGGSLPGFLAQFQKVPGENLTLIVLANSQRADPPRVAAVLGSVVLGETFIPSYDRETVRLEPEVLGKYAGDYEFEGRVFRIAVRGDRLFVHDTQARGPELELKIESDGTFFIGDGDISAVVNGRGEVTGLMVGGSDVPRLAKKVR